MRVLVWEENRPLPEHEEVFRRIYPDGVRGEIARFLSANEDLTVTTATMQDDEQGLSQEVLDATDVLVFWSHKHWRELSDEHAEYVQKRVLEGMGLVVLHSAHASKVLSRLLGTRTQSLRWRESDDWQRYWIVNPAHPIAEGLDGEFFMIPQDETYGEYFEIPQPDEQVFITQSEGGEIFRSGCCWYRGRGRIFYFQGGHETYPVYMQPEVQTVITNAVRWAYHRCSSTGFPVWARGPVPPVNR